MSGTNVDGRPIRVDTSEKKGGSGGGRGGFGGGRGGRGGGFRQNNHHEEPAGETFEFN